MLSSRERLLLTIDHREPDHIPLSFKWSLRNFLRDPLETWRNQFERVEWELKLGLDPTLHLSHPQEWKLSHEVNVKIWRDTLPGEKYPLMFKEYHTKRGMLRQVVRQTPDWPHGDNVPLWSDYMIPRSRSKEHLIKSIQDVEAFSNLFAVPTERDFKVLVNEAEHLKRFADEHGVLIEYEGMGIGDAVAHSFGIENMILASFKNPDLIHKLLDILLELSMRYLHQIIETEVVDIINYDGWSEAFFTPKLYKVFIFPRVQKLIELAHKSGVKFCYGARTPPLILFQFFKEMGVDIFWGPDPVQGNKDLFRLKEEVGEKICFWGGVNSYVTLGMGTESQIEDEVTKAIRTLGPGGGFILSAIDSLDSHTPWRNIEHMIKVWRKIGEYPLVHL